MASLKRNIIANFTGSVWTGVMGLVFIPFYIRLMGIEAYGIVGVFASLQAMFAVLDLGLSQTLNREMARLSLDSENKHRIADTVRTLEILYWAVAAGIILITLLGADIIAYRWLNPDQLSRETLRDALRIMAVVLGLRWPIALYMGGLNGLQRQELVNWLLCIFATLQGIGALVVLLTVAPTVHAFFLWQVVVTFIQVAAFRVALHRHAARGCKGIFSRSVLKGAWRFAAGMTGISLLATILTQLDKILLSKLLSLGAFGYYTFAATVAAVLYRLIGPVFTAYYPRLTTLSAENNRDGLAAAYHQGCQLMSAMIVPAALTLCVFSRQILEIWSKDAAIVENAFRLVSLLVVGNVLNGLMNMPLSLQLANGWTGLTVTMNAAAVLLLAPAIFVATSRWGAAGAACVWIALNVGYLLIGVQLMHRRLLPLEKWRWYIHDVGKPLLAAIAVTLSFRFMLLWFGGGNLIAAIVIAVAFGAGTLSIVLSAGSLRSKLLPARHAPTTASEQINHG